MAAALEVRAISKKLGTTLAVEHADFEVQTGTVYGLIGPNGSGKSTTIRCALGLLRPDRGEARVLGQDSADVPKLRGRLGVAFDDADLIDGLTARDNLHWARKVSGIASSAGRGPSEALAAVGLQDEINRRAGRMSLGQRRRLAIARALLGEPELIVLDEPLSGLDVTAVREMLDLFRELRAKGTTVVLSSHRLHEMEQVADAAAILYRGKMLHAGPLSEICGGDGRVIVHATPPPRALSLARSLQELGSAEIVPNPRNDGGPAEVLIVSLMKVSASELNRVLVEGGCEVSELRTEKRDLQRAFEDLVLAARNPEAAR